ncbi:MAG: GH9 [uncultured Cytophagales bacterium]|uniref:Endoglucanase n=1 Tax=uncultured Cytophagales bacterium TaxID=158755 RepID=A0A6J4JL11_9SPHI|nr:MAG: GH9 [uncultured Cytophagales bacterium]
MNHYAIRITGFLLALCLTALPGRAQGLTETIRLNQVGFYPDAPKVAVVPARAEGTFTVTGADGKSTVFTGTLGAPRQSGYSPKQTRLADFSKLTKPGTYVVVVPGLGHSYPFEVKPRVHRPLADAALKGFYYQRISQELTPQYAGKWARPAGHVQADRQVQIHPSAAGPGRPAGTVIASPGGWYDAGDYNKYIVNSGITVGTLLSLYEDFPAYFKDHRVNIPESGNAVPDLLDEALYNLRWMLTMQDPHDGGVYHKLTNPRFDGMVMPDKATNTRYVVQKSTAATLDFAAVAAQASRVYRAYDGAFPGLADSCLTAATRAWQWAQQHPAVLYQQDEMNGAHDPDVSTGTYGDNTVSDEWIWAACELYATTGKESYYTAVNLFPDDKMPLPGWPQVRLLGYYTLARRGDKLAAAGKKDLPMLKKRLVAFGDTLLAGVDRQPYGTVMGHSASDFIWGSTSVAANQGIALLQVYRLTGDKKYRHHALANLDYILGRNATGYSFVTGHGDKTPMHPHHRPSVADGIAEPVPGLLSGGTNANAARQDKCPGYASTVPDEVFLDHDCSYASNEIAINWQAPLVYLAYAVEALESGKNSGK